MISGALKARNKADTSKIAAKINSVRRRRLFRSPPRLRLLRAYAVVRAPLSERPVPEISCLIFQPLKSSVVFYHKISPSGFLLSRELPLFYGPELLFTNSTLLRPLPAPFLGDCYRNGVVESITPPALEEQRDLSHEYLGPGVLDAQPGLTPHERVEDVFEVSQGSGVSEDLFSE